MEKRSLGKRGLDVSALGFGCMGMTWAYGPSDGREAMIKLLREAVDRVFRTNRQVEETLRTDCRAVLPMLKNTPPAGGGQKSKTPPLAKDAVPRRIIEAQQALPESFEQVDNRPSKRRRTGDGHTLLRTRACARESP